MSRDTDLKAAEDAPRYRVIHRMLSQRIRSRSMPVGLVLTEGPLSAVFGTSRAPVRQALELLFNEGLIQRFAGRGFIVGDDQSAAPLRRPVADYLAGKNGEPDQVPAAGSRRADAMVSEVRNAVVTAMCFGEFRVHETALAEFYGINRTVAREILLRLNEQRLVRRHERGRWLAGPLTAKTIREEYEIRSLLEPRAFIGSASRLTRERVSEELERIAAISTRRSGADLTQIEMAEAFLHNECLSSYENRRMREVVRRSQLPIFVNKVFFATLNSTESFFPALDEHRFVLEHLLRGAVEAAAAALQAHLDAASRRTMLRLKSMSVFPEPELPDYFIRLH